jgi:outer membrane protein
LRVIEGCPSGISTDKVRHSMRTTAKTTGLLLSAFLLSAVSNDVSADIERLEKVALVDVQRCIMETREGRDARDNLEKSFSRNNAKLEQRAKKHQSKIEDLRNKASILSQADLMKRQEALMRSEAELQELYERYAQDLSQKEAMLTEKIYSKTSRVAEQIAKSEDIQMVLVRSDSTVLYANPKIDITNRVIVAYDKK